jgi:polysaccharide deacetylase family protein (PEP-CTERM system associated)
MTNALTVDVEEWFQVSNFDGVVTRGEWDAMPSRVEASTRRLMDLFERFDVCATFFVLGWVAERRADLVREIRTRGHDVASHGYNHELVYRLGRARFEEDLRKSVRAIEDVTGVRPSGYRAPSFSIDRRVPWAFDVLAAEGFTYDSSIFPVKHPRYGVPDFPRAPRRIRTLSGATLREFPMTTLRLPGFNVGASGGAWLRVLPPLAVRTAFARMNAAGQPAVLYVHPWEVDPDQPRLRVGLLKRLAHYTNLARTEARLASLLERFPFGTMEQALRHAPDLAQEPIEVGA